MVCRNIFGVSLIAIFVTVVFVTDAKRPQKLLRSNDAMPGDVKYQVSLRRGKYHACGGALISNRHVLTAAHCFVGRVDPPYTERLVVVSGVTKLSIGGDEHLPKFITIHPQYVKGNSDNRWRHDIAIITLASPVTTNALQAPVSLPTNNITKHVVGLISGWGQMQRGWDGEYPDNLKKSPVTILTQEDCASRNTILETQICGFDGRGTGICEGDSGSPLVYNNEIVGIASFSTSCGIGYPDFYTRVYAYKDFIRETMNRE